MFVSNLRIYDSDCVSGFSIHFISRAGTYLEMFCFQPPLFVMGNFKIEKDNFIGFYKLFNPPRVVSFFQDLCQKAEFYAKITRN